VLVLSSKCAISRLREYKYWRLSREVRCSVAACFVAPCSTVG
jgi:hypothetical protein